MSLASYKTWPFVSGFFDLASCCKVQPWYLIFSNCQIIFPCMDITHLVYSSAGRLGSFHFEALKSKAAENICTSGFVDMFSLGYIYLGVELPGYVVT